MSTVAIAIAIGLSGIAAGSASIGIAATEAVLLIGTSKVNHVGIPLSIFFGGVKMMMPNMVKYPVIMIPIFLTAAISGIFRDYWYFRNKKNQQDLVLSEWLGLLMPLNLCMLILHG